MKKRMKKVLSFFMAAVLALGSVPVTAYAQTGTKPEDGTTKNQPFDSGTAGSTEFRIPCFVTLDDGTLVAGCDARWNTYGDGGGLDTIVSRSTDGGKTWNYTMANYLGDNGNVWNRDSTAFIDPAMATDGKTVYLVADLFPAGIALNSAHYAPVPGQTGYNENHQLVLAKVTDTVNGLSPAVDRAAAAFDYHLEKIEGAKANDAAYYNLIGKDGEAVEGYEIDGRFNIKGNDIDTNLFCGDTPYFTFPTDYLYMTKSENGGATWSLPTLIDLKKTTEQTLLVGPGRGIVTSEGRIAFTAYDFTNGDRFSLCIYSDDGGVTWERGDYVSEQSSEAVVTEADGKLFIFTRHGGYYVSDDWGKTWSPKKDMGFTYDLTTQLSAITYSEKIDGKTAIIFSAPTNGRRYEGKLFTGLVQDNGTIEWKYSYNVNGKNDVYAYSCLDECADGSIGLLYEYDGSKITYKNIPIEDIVPDAEIGGMWLTDADGNATTSVMMGVEETKTFTVNGAADSAEVTVSDENALTASYADGTLTVTSKAGAASKSVKITVTSGTETAVLNVYVTASENYAKVQLAMGETKVIKDETGNYSNADLSGLDKGVAEVTVEGEDYHPLERASRAQLATNVAAFGGEVVELDDCLYTFKAAGAASQYIVSSKTADGTDVYLSMNAGANVPNKTEAVANTVAYDAEKGQFTLYDGARYLYFWKNDTAKLYFDRNSTVDGSERTHFEFYQKSAEAPDDSPIMGYAKVNAVTDGGQYLIAAKAADNNYYILHPSASGVNYNHVAKVVITGGETAEDSAQAQLATAPANFNGETISSGDCLYTFTAAETEGQYSVSAQASNGTTVYLSQRRQGVPNGTTSSAITPAYSAAEGGFSLFDNSDISSAGGYLWFWKADTTKLHFDRYSSAAAGNCFFELYRPSSAASDSPIAGYEKVTEVTAGEKYLITAKASDGAYYALYPSTDGNKWAHGVKLLPPAETSRTGKTTITIKGVSEGMTSVTVGSTTYYITVKNTVKNITVNVGEKFVIPGIPTSDPTGDTASFTLAENTELPPYARASKADVLAGGKYLIGQTSYVMINRASEVAGTPKGMAMAPVNLADTKAEDTMWWTVTKVDGGYTLQDENQKYLTFSGSNVQLSDTPQTLSITDGPSADVGSITVSYGGQYLNNYSRANNRVAGYSVNDCPWYFYVPAEGIVVTANAAGTMDVIADGVTYHVTAVVPEEPKAPVYTAYVDGEEVQSGEYNTKVELHADPSKNGKDFVCWMAGSTADAASMKPVSTKTDYTFFLANDIYLTAVYEEKTIKPSAEIINTIALPNEAAGKINARFVGQLTMPEGAKLLDAGLVWSSSYTPKELNLDSGAKVTHISKISTSYQFSVTINGVPSGRFVRGVIFAKYQLKDGTTGYQAADFVYSGEETIYNN